jgi:2-methylaconitate cis-trans-isomerase PrpF
VVRIGHGNGVIAVVVQMARENGLDGVMVEKVTVSRTARRLFEGNVLFNLWGKGL